MAMYAVGVIPLIKLAQSKVSRKDDIQGWLADDAQAVGTLEALRDWFDVIIEQGPLYGYYVNPEKSQLIVKPHCMEKAREIFKRYWSEDRAAC